MKGLITTTEAAAMLGLDPSAIRHRIRKGTLKATKVGRDNLVSRAVIEREARCYCHSCGVSITATDEQAGYCTNCQTPLVV